MHYVYMIQKGYGSIKIGVSKDPAKRLCALQTGNHGELKLIASFPFSSRKQADHVEKQLHRMFSRDRLNGEWFHKRILRQFKNRAVLFPQIFNGGVLNDYGGIDHDAMAHMKSIAAECSP